MNTSGLSKFNQVLHILPKSSFAAVVAFGVVQYAEWNLISLINNVPVIVSTQHLASPFVAE